MRTNISRLLVMLIFANLFFAGCKKWDDHNTITDERAGKDLLVQITENANLSKFALLLQKSGYDKLIASSKNYTVFVPTNAALASLDPAIENDSSKLRLFVGNHIANQLYNATDGAATVRVPLLNGKYHNLTGKKIEDATIAEANKFAKNGMLHIIDKMLPALPSVWEFLQNDALVATNKEKQFLFSLFQNVFDTTNAIQIGVNPLTGAPIYQPGTDSVRTNLFWRNVHDLRNERKQYTLFVLADAAWDAEVNKYKPYYVTGTADSTTRMAGFAVVKDLAFDTVYLPGTIPDTIRSKFNAKVGIDKSAIVQTIKTSNGIIYIMNKVEVVPKDKFQQYFIEAENFSFTRVNRAGNTYFRDKLNPVTAKIFRDVVVYNHGVAEYYQGYRLSDVPSLKFKAYWVAVHDNINSSTVTFTQKLGIETFNSTLLPYTTVTLNNYNEVYIGEFTMTKYSPVLNVFLTAANNTTANTNMLVCDYIRLEPVL